MYNLVIFLLSAIFVGMNVVSVCYVSKGEAAVVKTVDSQLTQPLVYCSSLVACCVVSGAVSGWHVCAVGRVSGL